MALIVSPSEAKALIAAIAADARQRGQAPERAPRRAERRFWAPRGIGWGEATVEPATARWQPPERAVYARARAAWAGASRAEKRAGMVLSAGWLVRPRRRDREPSG